MDDDGIDDYVDTARDIMTMQLHILDLESNLRVANLQIASQRVQMDMLQASILDATGGNRAMIHHHHTAGLDLPPLLMSAERGDCEMLTILLDPEASPPATPELINMALLTACQKGHEDAALKLLLSGADVHTDHDSALLWACRAGNCKLVETLLLHGADVNTLDGCPMRIVACSGDSAIARVLMNSAQAKKKLAS